MGHKDVGHKDVGVNSYAVGRRRPVSTFVEKDEECEYNLILSRRGPRLGVSPHSAGVYSHAPSPYASVADAPSSHAPSANADLESRA